LIGATLLSLVQPTHSPTLGAHSPASATVHVGAGAPDLTGDNPQAAAVMPERVDFPAFVEGLRQDALARGIRPAIVDAALADLEPQEQIIQSDQKQSEFVQTVDQYVARRLTPTVIRTAREMSAKHRPLLRRVSARYGVQHRFVVSIWGLESNFGRRSGTEPTIEALATLAWEGRRGPFFRGELMNALDILDKGYIGLDQLLGSWAGAMGQPQFMPSSYLKWAQDFDGDGDRDIWQSSDDVFASIANYLKEHGWQSNSTWGREVKLPAGGLDVIREKAGMRAEGCRAEREMTNRLSLKQWQALGVRTMRGRALPKVAIDASLIHTGERAFLVYGNYESLLKYNCAHAYALAVALLADRVGG
jgi:membrane-bound lytic murein transglycosylase B